MTDQARETLVDAIAGIAPNLHGSGTFPEAGLRALARHAGALGAIKNSAETGSGASTLLLSHLSDHHVTFTVDSGSGSLDNVRTSPLFRSERVTVVEGPTQITLPKYEFRTSLQFALIDGPHGYPFPDLEYYYFYPHIESGGLLVVDDINIRSIHNLYDFLAVDDMWHLEEVVETTAFFKRTAAPVFFPTGDGWWQQRYNNPG